FTRCLRCNSLLRVVAKDRVQHLLPERTRESYREFSRCPTCHRVYWQGTHYSAMRLFIERAFAAATRAWPRTGPSPPPPPSRRARVDAAAVQPARRPAVARSAASAEHDAVSAHAPSA